MPSPLLPAVPGLPRVHVVYGSDAANFGGLLVSMLSLLAHLQEPGNCSVHVIVPPEDAERAERLLECFRREAHGRARASGAGNSGVPEVLLHRMRPLDFDTSNFSTTEGTTHRLVYTKFVLQSFYLPGIARALWLDTDTIVQADVAPLFRMPMAHPLAAAVDFGYSTFEFHRPSMHVSAHDLVRDWQARTFTTGVLLYDLDRWRAEAFHVPLADLAQRLSGYDGEQLPMNLFFQDGFDLLDSHWNVVQPLHYQELTGWIASRGCARQAWIIHGTGGKRKYWHAESSRLFDDLLQPYLPSASCAAWLEGWRAAPEDSGVWHA